MAAQHSLKGLAFWNVDSLDYSDEPHGRKDTEEMWTAIDAFFSNWSNFIASASIFISHATIIQLPYSTCTYNYNFLMYQKLYVFFNIRTRG